MIAYLLIRFGVQTVFLVAALWIMIKLQKLNHSFLGMVGAAALASAIDLIPLPFHIADYISCAVLLLCMSKVTGAEYVDVAFTVFVGYALMFGMNLWLLGTLMGDLRPSTHEAENRRFTEEMEHKEDATRERQTTEAANQMPGTNRASVAVKAQTVKSPEEKLPSLSVKSLIRNGTRSCVTLQSENDSRMIFLGDTELVHTATGPLNVRFDGLTNEFVLLTVGERQVKLAAR